MPANLSKIFEEIFEIFQILENFHDAWERFLTFRTYATFASEIAVEFWENLHPCKIKYKLNLTTLDLYAYVSQAKLRNPSPRFHSLAEKKKGPLEFLENCLPNNFQPNFNWNFISCLHQFIPVSAGSSPFPGSLIAAKLQKENLLIFLLFKYKYPP